MNKPLGLLCIYVCLGTSLIAQTSFTISKDSIQGSPKASLEDIAWIQGHWKGMALGGITEEIWSPPLGESMMGVFKLVVNDKVRFYEILTIVEEAESLILRLKHFDAKLVGWEEKAETVDFELVKVRKDRVYFDDFTFEKDGKNMNVYVVIGQKDGKKEEVRFSYQRID